MSSSRTPPLSSNAVAAASLLLHQHPHVIEEIVLPTVPALMDHAAATASAAREFVIEDNNNLGEEVLSRLQNMQQHLAAPYFTAIKSSFPLPSGNNASRRSSILECSPPLSSSSSLNEMKHYQQKKVVSLSDLGLKSLVNNCRAQV
jgi:hypothetical protein